MPSWSYLLLTLAVSVDSFGTGIAYGVRRIRMPLMSLLIVGLCTGSLMSVSMAVGSRLTPFLPPGRATSLGGFILVMIGVWQLLRGWRQYLGYSETSTRDRPLLHLRISILGVAIQVLRDPAAADMNRSGTIDTKESVVLGAALGLDAFAAGFGVSMAGFSLGIVPAVALSSMLFVYIGSWIGHRTIAHRLGHKAFILPGILLIALGLRQF